MDIFKLILGNKKHSQELAQLQKDYDRAIARNCHGRAEMIAEVIDAYYSPKGDLSVVGEIKDTDNIEEKDGFKVINRKYKYVGNKNMEIIARGILGDDSAWDELQKRDKELVEKRSKICLVENKKPID